MSEDEDLLDCFLNLPNMETAENIPLNFKWIEEGQPKDLQMQNWKHRLPTKFIIRQIGNETKLITHVKPGDNADMEWKIVLPEAQIEPVIKWFHQVLGHPGENRLRDTILMRYYHPDLRRHIDNFVCNAFQKHKLSVRGLGLLPGQDVNIYPWHEVAVDLIGLQYTR